MDRFALTLKPEPFLLKLCAPGTPNIVGGFARISVCSCWRLGVSDRVLAGAQLLPQAGDGASLRGGEACLVTGHAVDRPSPPFRLVWDAALVNDSCGVADRTPPGDADRTRDDATEAPLDGG